MNVENWLRLNDYSSKYRISVSTLRRRIKHGQITHRFDDGKYYILDQTPTLAESSIGDIDEPHSAAPQTAFASIARSRVHDESEALMMEAQERLDRLRETSEQPPAPVAVGDCAAPAVAGEPAAQGENLLFTSANRLMGELKRAYMNVLTEKEEQIIQLKEEVSDLKTLVRVPEDSLTRRPMNQGYQQARDF